LLAGIYLIWQPPTTDLAAQVFRADLWERAGFVIWNPDWYDGHSVPGYSLLYPPLGAWLGPALLGAVSAVAATWIFGRLALDAFGERAWLGVVWFGLASAVALYSGRITFALGLAVGLGALLAVQRERVVWAAALGVLASAASPVAGLFVALAGASVVLASRFPLASRPAAELPVRAAVAAALGALVMIALLSLAFPTSGYHPFAFSAYIWIPLLAIAVLVLTGAREGPLLWGVVLYTLLGLAAVVFDTPLGGNVTRLGATFAGPLLAILLLGRRTRVLVALAIPLLFWQWQTTVEDVARAEGDPSTKAAYFEPLLDKLSVLSSGPVSLKLHVPPTRSRWEATYLAESYPIARGWLRQEESEDFRLFRGERIDPDEYLEWLVDRGVSYVALPDAEPDYLARSERVLIRSGDSPLELVWSGEHWSLWAVPGAPAEQGAEALRLRPDGFTVELRGVDVSIPLRYSPYFEVVAGDACVEPDPQSPRRTLVTRTEFGSGSEPATPITVEASFSLAAAVGRERQCSPDAEPGT
jgi:hypothetical protein